METIGHSPMAVVHDLVRSSQWVDGRHWFILYEHLGKGSNVEARGHRGVLM
jgi:hypothetical protein